MMWHRCLNEGLAVPTAVREKAHAEYSQVCAFSTVMKVYAVLQELLRPPAFWWNVVDLKGQRHCPEQIREAILTCVSANVQRF